VCSTADRRRDERAAPSVGHDAFATPREIMMTDPFDRPPTSPADGPAAGDDAAWTPPVQPEAASTPTLPPAQPRVPSTPAAAPFGAPLAAPTVDPVTGPTPGRRSRGKMIGALVGVVAIVAAGVFAITQLSGDDNGSAGGAASPEDLANDFVDALNNEDALGLIDLLLPGERDTFRQPAIDLIDELKRIEVLDGSADLGKVSALDVQIDDVDIDVQDTNVDDIATVSITGPATVTLHGDKVPVGDLLVDLGFGGERPQIDDDTDDEDLDATLTVVRKDGDWYLSLFYSAAQAAAQGQDVPDEGITARGADSPEGAVEQLLEATSHLDLEGIIATLNPNEAEALQRYAPLFLDDAQAELDKVQASIDIDDISTKVFGSGGTRQVAVESFTADVSAEGEQIHLEANGRCLTVEGAGQSFDSCESEASTDLDAQIDQFLQGFADQVGVDPSELQPLADSLTGLAETLQDSLADVEFHGIVVKQVDGKWFVSPIATGSEGFLSVLRALDRGEIEDISSSIQDLIAEFSSLSTDFG
jgi:hypothetical protein